MASPARFERAAFRLGGERSILLSYGDTSSIIEFLEGIVNLFRGRRGRAQREKEEKPCEQRVRGGGQAA